MPRLFWFQNFSCLFARGQPSALVLLLGDHRSSSTTSPPQPPYHCPLYTKPPERAISFFLFTARKTPPHCWWDPTGYPWRREEASPLSYSTMFHHHGTHITLLISTVFQSQTRSLSPSFIACSLPAGSGLLVHRGGLGNRGQITTIFQRRTHKNLYTKLWLWDFPGGPVVKTPCFLCREQGGGLMPSQGTKISHATQHSQTKKKSKQKHWLHNPLLM